MMVKNNKKIDIKVCMDVYVIIHCITGPHMCKFEKGAHEKGAQTYFWKNFQ